MGIPDLSKRYINSDDKEKNSEHMFIALFCFNGSRSEVGALYFEYTQIMQAIWSALKLIYQTPAVSPNAISRAAGGPGPV